MKKQTIVERSSSTRSYAGVVVAVLCVLCAVPAMVISYVNRPLMTMETLSKPFIKQPKESGAAYTEKTPVIDEALTIPEVVVNGVAKNSNRAAPPQKTDKNPSTAGGSNATRQSELVIETPEINIIGTTVNEEDSTGGAAWMQDSLVGGTVRITGFDPNR